jgi:hypothetical protein
MRPSGPAVGRLAVAALVGVLMGTSMVGAGAAPSPTTSAAGPADWPVYHHDVRGTGVDGSGARFAPARPAWTSPALDGAIFGEPLSLGATVYVATENDTVYALRAADGGVAWSTHLGTPVPDSSLPCGDIEPAVGITGTPVLDPGRDELFAVADVDAAGSPSHVLVGLSLATGAVELRQPVDPEGTDTAALLQRTGLTLEGGQVVFGLGGNYSDCSSYHGWVEAVPESGGTPRTFAIDGGAGQREGAVWMGGAAPVVDPSGDIWVAVGNGSEDSARSSYDDSDSVLELSPALALVQFFAPSDWASDNANDRDLGSSVPALLPNGLVVQAGKSRTAYLLRASHLGGIGGQIGERSDICGDDVSGGAAVVGTIVYLPCLTGLVAVRATAAPPALQTLWQTPSGSGGPPIVAGGLVWTIDQSGTLFALDPADGTVVQQFALGAEANHFPTPSVGDGLVLAPSADQIHAFAGPGVPGASPTSTTTSPPTGATGARASGGATATPATRAPTRPGSGGGAGWVVPTLVLALVVVVAGAALFGRARRRRSAR